MLIKCPRCSKIISTTSQQVVGEDSLTCHCGQDLSEFGGRSRTTGEKIASGLRIAFRNGMVGGMLGAVFSVFVTRRFIQAVANQWGAIGVWLALAAGPLVGFLLAATLGDRFLDRVDELLK